MDYGWVPSGGTYVAKRQDGSVRESSVATIKKFEINPVISKDEFEIDFPPGTDVLDQRKAAKLRHYIVQPDGSAGIFPKGATYREASGLDP